MSSYLSDTRIPIVLVVEIDAPFFARMTTLQRPFCCHLDECAQGQQKIPPDLLRGPHWCMTKRKQQLVKTCSKSSRIQMLRTKSQLDDCNRCQQSSAQRRLTQRDTAAMRRGSGRFPPIYPDGRILHLLSCHPNIMAYPLSSRDLHQFTKLSPCKVLFK